MGEALMLVQFLSAAASAGMTMMPLLEKVSALIVQRHAAGKTYTADDLHALLDDGDVIERQARKQFADTLADPNTPRLA